MNNSKNEKQQGRFSKCLGNAVFLVTAFFLCINLYDAFGRFGWQAVDLPPVQFFFFSLWVAVRNVVGHTLLAVAPLFLFGRLARWIVIPALCYVVGINVILKYTDRVYHAALSEIWPMLVLNTSFEEMKNFLKFTLTPTTILCTFAVCLVLFFCSRLLARAHYPRFSRRSFFYGCALIVPFVVLNMLTMNWHFGLGQTYYTDFIFSSYATWQKMKGIDSACSKQELPVKLALDTDLAQAPNVIIILGESETRNNWHLYGYPRQTTPHMDALCSGGGVCFRNVVETQPDTAEALCLMLTDVSFDRMSEGSWTLSEVYRRAGYRGVLISNNQYAWSDNMNSYLNRIFASCEKLISVHSEFPENKKWFDDCLAPILKRELASVTDRPNLVFIHMAGIHYPVHGVIPPTENYFSDSVDADHLKGLSAEQRDHMNRYDNGIRFEDKVRGELVDAVKACGARPACVVYISDHGESPRSPGWRDHADLDTYEVPMFVWFSESYQRAFPDVVARTRAAADRPMQGDELTFGLIEFGRISGIPGVKPQQSFLHPDFRGRFPRQINKGRIVYSPDLKGALSD